MVNTKNWRPYLDLLFCFFSVFQNNKLTEIPKEIPLVLKDLIPQLIHMERICGNSHLRECILEIVLHLPLPMTGSLFNYFIPILMPLYLKGLSGPETLQRPCERGTLLSRVAMNYLETFFQRVPTADMITLLQNEPCKSMLTSSLSTILHTSSNQRITTQALALLGRLGGRSRTVLRGDVDLPCFSNPSNGYEVLFPSASSVLSHHLITMDSHIAEAVEFLFRNLIVEPLDDTTAKLSQKLRCSPENVEMTRSIRVQYKLRAIDMIEKCITACVSNPSVVMNPLVCYRLAMCLGDPNIGDMETEDDPAQEETLVQNEKTQERCVSLLLYGLMLACCDSEVKDVALEKMKAFFTYFACLILNYTRFRTDEKDDLSALLSKSSKYHGILMHLALGVVPVLSPFVISFPPDCLSPLLLSDVLVALLDNEFPSVEDLVVEASLVIWKVVEEQAQRQARESCLATGNMDGNTTDNMDGNTTGNMDRNTTGNTADSKALPIQCSELWMALPYMETFLASLLMHCVGNGWRCRVVFHLLLSRSTTR